MSHWKANTMHIAHENSRGFGILELGKNVAAGSQDTDETYSGQAILRKRTVVTGHCASDLKAERA